MLDGTVVVVDAVVVVVDGWVVDVVLVGAVVVLVDVVVGAVVLVLLEEVVDGVTGIVIRMSVGTLHVTAVSRTPFNCTAVVSDTMLIVTDPAAARWPAH